MKISIEEIQKDEKEEIIVRCHEITDDLLQLISRLNKKDHLLGYKEDAIHRLRFSQIYYFESVDNKVFIYCEDTVYESRQRLYELEEICQGKKFFRASKSILLNLAKITSVRPTLSGRFEAKLNNKEKVLISRHYVPVLKEMLGL